MRRRLRPGLPLRMQVTLLVLAVTLPAAAFVAHTAWRDRALMLAEAARAPEQLAAAAAAAQAQTVGAVLRLLERLAAAPVLQTADREPCATLLDGAARLEPRIREIAALGEAGTIRCGAPSAAPADVTALLRQLKGGTALSLQPPEPGAAAGTGEWTVAVPIRNAEGDVAGALRARLAADPLDGPIPGQTLPEGAYRLLVNAAGEIVGRFPADAGPGPPAATLKAALAGDRQTTFEARDLAGTALRFGIAGLPGTGYAVAVGIPEATGRYEADRRFRDRVAGPLALWALALLATWAAVQLLIARRLRALGRAAAAWSAGHHAKAPMPWLRSELSLLARTMTLLARRSARRDRSLHRALAEQEAEIREMHRCLGSNLEIVAGLLDLQRRRVRSPDLRHHLREAQARIQTLGVVQDRLHSSREPGQVDIRQVLLGICDELLELHGVGDRVRCEVEVPGFAIAMERAVPLALLAAEAVMNALQHAFPGGRVGTVWIRFSETPDEVRIAIEDDGIGISGNVADLGGGGAVGLRLMQALANQLSAKLEISSSSGVSVRLALARRLLGS